MHGLFAGANSVANGDSSFPTEGYTHKTFQEEESCSVERNVSEVRHDQSTLTSEG